MRWAAAAAAKVFVFSEASSDKVEGEIPKISGEVTRLLGDIHTIVCHAGVPENSALLF